MVRENCGISGLQDSALDRVNETTMYTTTVIQFACNPIC